MKEFIVSMDGKRIIKRHRRIIHDKLCRVYIERITYGDDDTFVAGYWVTLDRAKAVKFGNEKFAGKVAQYLTKCLVANTLVEEVIPVQEGVVA